MRMGIDIGGTFTDVAALDEMGVLHTGKRLTTVGSEHAGVLEAARDSAVPMESLGVLTHGTTLVINALLERKGAKTALVTTKGFRDVHEMGRGNRPEIFNAVYRRDPPLIPRELRFEVCERVNSQGEIESFPASGELCDLAEKLRAAEVEAVAVACLNSFIEPRSEQAIVDFLSEQLPDLPITSSASISRQWREYERTTTACANAYVRPLASRYLGELLQGLRNEGFGGDFLVLDSNGGALHHASAARYPIKATESGPVGGAIGARALAEELGLANIVTFDMGGTTAKTCLIEHGHLASTDVYWVGGYERGFPVQVPSIDIVEVGAGGGSIAWVDRVGRLRVGPRSAGASPGPACYGGGGKEVTVTDANAYCARVSDQTFLGKLDLHPALARAAMLALARRLGVDSDRLAVGVIELANLQMAAAVRRQTVERGRDPRDCAMVAFGGAGPMHACEVAQKVGLYKVIVPPSPGVFSAIGMLRANMRFDRREVFLTPLSMVNAATLGQVLKRASSEMSSIQGLGDHGHHAIRESYALALRYRGQEHAVDIRSPFPDLTVGDNAPQRFQELFEQEYEQRFGHLDERSLIEVVEVAVDRERVLPSVSPRIKAMGDRVQMSEPVLFDYSGERLETPYIFRGSLSTDGQVEGPAVIYEDGSHTVLPPGARAKVVTNGSIEIVFET
jgi:N-methylhydantoinase A